MSIKGHNSVKKRPKIMCIRKILDLVYINAYPKNHPFVLKILRKNTLLHQSRAITLLLINELSPFATPNHSSPISMSMQSLKKIEQKLLVRVQKRSADGRTDGPTDGQTDGHSKRLGGYDIIPQGIKINQKSQNESIQINLCFSYDKHHTDIK